MLASVRDDSLVLIDGLLAAQAPEAMVRESGRLRLVVLAHMLAASIARESERPAALGRERRALDAAVEVVATSRWTRDALLSEGIASPDRIVVARPGVAPAPATASSDTGGRLLCVGVVAPHKGQDVLLRALAGLGDAPDWTCTFAGSLAADPDFASALHAVTESAGLQERIRFTGVLTGRQLEDAYATADLLVAPSRVEGFGMAVADALARGVPVIASRVGGLPEAIGASGAGILVPPDDPSALRAALRRWWADAGARSALRAEALRTRHEAPGWRETAEVVAVALRQATSHGRASVAAGRSS
jgi:glycosyltransferase involved in cell wall biosynthesis